MKVTSYTTRSVQDLEKLLNTSLENGLSTSAVEHMRQAYGFNEIKSEEVRWWHILLNQCKSPFLLLLLASVVLSFVTKSPLDAIVVLIILGINTLLGFYQEYAAYLTLSFLKQFTIPLVHVRRDGHEKTIPQRELLPGDIVILSAGDVIPADVRFVQVRNILVDEAALTGESIPVGKTIEPLSAQITSPVDAKNCGFAGTTVLSGTAIALVAATGQETMLGSIAHLTSQTSHIGVFQKDITAFSLFIMYLIIGTLSLVVILNLIIKKGAIDFFDLLLFALALALGITPEALPVIATFALARGAGHLARHKVIVKRLSSIDDLGSIQVLCVDKTGTLTENVLTVVDTFHTANNDPIEYAMKAVMALATKEDYTVDALDDALKKYAETKKYDQKPYCLMYEIPYDPARRRGIVVIQNAEGNELIMRGVYDEIIKHCSPLEDQDAQQWNQEQGKQGKRVIAVAVKKIATMTDFDLEKEEQALTLVGLIAYADPIKPGVEKSLEDAQHLGLRVKILSGDAPEVVAFVAQTLGLIKSADQVITGAAFNALSPLEQQATVDHYTVFARVSPKEKYEIIKMLQEHDDVGYLGDGMNDAPALKMANVGMVVQGAVESAREAADIILLKKSLRVIVDGIKKGGWFLTIPSNIFLLF